MSTLAKKIHRPTVVRLFIFVFIGFFASSFAFTENSYVHSKDSFSILVAPYAYAYTDLSNEKTIQQVSDDTFNQFTPIQKKNIDFGVSSSSNWVKFKVSDIGAITNEDPSQYVLFFNYAAIGAWTLYVPVLNTNGDLEYSDFTGGPFQRDHKRFYDEGFLFPSISMPENAQFSEYMFIRFNSPYATTFQIEFADKRSFEQKKQGLLLFLALVFGIMLAMLIYNGVLFITLKDKNYFTYILHLVLIILYQGGITGIFRIFSPVVGDWIIRNVIPFANLSLGSYYVFVWFFINVNKNTKILKYSFFLIWAGLSIGFLCAINNNIIAGNIIAHIGAVFTPIIVLLTIIACKRNGQWISKYYLASIVTLLTSIVIFGLRGYGIIGHNIFVSYTVVTAVSIEALLSSFALAERIRIIQTENLNLHIREEELSTMTITDPLTKLFNRRLFDQKLTEISMQSRQSETPLAMLILDIDHFKKVNDTYGHQAGDEILKKLSHIMNAHVKKHMLVSRIGGEEFAILCPQTTQDEAYTIAERIRSGFSCEVFNAEGHKPFSVTISIGISVLKNDDSDAQFLRRSDTALYQAKALGRNQTIIR